MLADISVCFCKFTELCILNRSPRVRLSVLRSAVRSWSVWGEDIQEKQPELWQVPCSALATQTHFKLTSHQISLPLTLSTHFPQNETQAIFGTLGEICQRQKCRFPKSYDLTFSGNKPAVPWQLAKSPEMVDQIQNNRPSSWFKFNGPGKVLIFD